MPGIFSGNGSVRWVVEVNNVKGIPKSEFRGDKGYYQDGLDDTPPNGRFVITIRYPKDPIGQDAFRKQLLAASANTASAAVLTIPVEDVQSGFDPPTDAQIRVDW